MGETVWKFPLRLTYAQQVEMPIGAHVIHVAEQLGILCMWAIVDPSAPTKSREFLIVGTGHTIPHGPDTIHVGSALCDGGDFVWHVFEQGYASP